jgi:hypothetical protein
MNKEILEQAAEQMYPNKPYATGDKGIMYDEFAKQRIGFIEGAKWQADKMYSEEEVKQIFNIGQQIKAYGDYKPYTFDEALELFKK